MTRLDFEQATKQKYSQLERVQRGKRMGINKSIGCEVRSGVQGLFESRATFFRLKDAEIFRRSIEIQLLKQQQQQKMLIS
jgi:hypothetical protein